MLKRMMLVAALAWSTVLALALAAAAQTAFLTPDGQRSAPGGVLMCRNGSGQAIPAWDASGNWQCQSSVAVTATQSAFTGGGWTPKWFIAANSDNATNLKASAGVVHAVEVYGIGSAPAYLKFYDKATAPTCASDTIVKQIMIPAASTAANGAGANIAVLDAQFSTGISYCVVTGIAANDDTSPAAATFVVNIDWK